MRKNIKHISRPYRGYPKGIIYGGPVYENRENGDIRIQFKGKEYLVDAYRFDWGGYPIKDIRPTA